MNDVLFFSEHVYDPLIAMKWVDHIKTLTRQKLIMTIEERTRDGRRYLIQRGEIEHPVKPYQIAFRAHAFVVLADPDEVRDIGDVVACVPNAVMSGGDTVQRTIMREDEHKGVYRGVIQQFRRHRWRNENYTFTAYEYLGEG